MQPITLYLFGRRTSYTPANQLIETVLGTENRQARIAASVALTYRDFIRHGEAKALSGQLAELAEQFQTTPSGVINFALAYATGKGVEC